MGRPHERFTIPYLEEHSKEFLKDKLIRDMTTAELQEAYSSYSRTARKAIARFEEAGLTDAYAYQANVGRFRTVSEIKAQAREESRYTRTGRERSKKEFEREVNKRLSREYAKQLEALRKMLLSSRSSVSGEKSARRKTIKTLHKQGYDFITDSNLREFGQFMSYVRQMNGGRLPDSERVVEKWGEYKEAGMTPAQIRFAFAKWTKEQNKINKKKKKTAAGVTKNASDSELMQGTIKGWSRNNHTGTD